MSAVSNIVMPRSSARWITLREVSRSVRWPKLLQPTPTAETRRPEPPRLRMSMEDPVRRVCEQHSILTPAHFTSKASAEVLPCAQKKQPRLDAATDRDRLGA